MVPALQAVVEAGLSAEARQYAQAALLALSDQEMHADEIGQKHVMLSYCWVHQQTVQRINESLNRRGYLTWFD